MDYVPDECSQGSHSTSDSELSMVENEPQPNASKKRMRKVAQWKRSEAKLKRNSGEKYVGRRGEVHEAKAMKLYAHTCRYKCNKNFIQEVRMSIFSDFWDLGKKQNGWDLQTSFITSCVSKQVPKRHNRQAASQKNISTIITLKNFRVCKQFFLCTLDISQKRFYNVITKMRETGVPKTDERGRHPPGNKLSEDKINLVKEHINSFPKFISHYTRKDNPNRKYLSPELNLSKMYVLYKDFCAQRRAEPVKISKYRDIFNTQFNLSFHRPYTDTCSTCDILKIKIDALGPDSEEKKVLVRDQEIHLRKVSAVKALKNYATNLAKESPQSRRAICFDLQKTLPTPYLTCSKVYYLRQLWTYNFGIHDLATGIGSMYMWHEGEAGKGSQEVLSCLLKYIQCLPETVTHIDAFSDNCGGQNKNKNIVKFWTYIVQHSYIKSVDHRFLVSGHSFMECDQDFALIEKAKRKLTHLFTPDDWIHFVGGVSRKFIVVKMTDDDFKSVSPMDNYMQSNIIGLSKMQWLHFEREQPYKLFYKENYNQDFPFYIKDLIKKTEKTTSGRPKLLPATVVLPNLHANPPQIKLAKYQNLMQLLPFVPPIHHKFYKDLSYEGKTSRLQQKKANKTQDEDPDTYGSFESDSETD